MPTLKNTRTPALTVENAEAKFADHLRQLVKRATFGSGPFEPDAARIDERLSKLGIGEPPAPRRIGWSADDKAVSADPLDDLPVDAPMPGSDPLEDK